MEVWEIYRLHVDRPIETLIMGRAAEQIDNNNTHWLGLPGDGIAPLSRRNRARFAFTVPDRT